jgi:hypothetical protein
MLNMSAFSSNVRDRELDSPFPTLECLHFSQFATILALNGFPFYCDECAVALHLYSPDALRNF